jgi:ABC-type sugar transport system substrate-binding protein
MKRVISILLALVMMLAFAACTSNPQTSSTSSETQSTGASGESKFTIGLSLNDLDEVQSTVYQYLQEICAEKDIELVLANAAGNIDQQLTDIENFTTNKVDIIVVSALDSNAVVDVCNKAKEAGIPVVDYIMGIGGSVDVHFGYNFYDMAATQAKALINYLTENSDAKLKIGYMWGSNSMELCQQLYKGFTETMAKSDVKDRYEIVVEGTTDWAADKAITLAEDWMQSNPEINCFVTQSDTLTVGVCEALRASGKNFGDYITVGKDGTADALKSIAAGEMTYTIYSPLDGLAKYLVQTCEDLYDGKISGPDYEARISDYIIVDKENAADYQ